MGMLRPKVLRVRPNPWGVNPYHRDTRSVRCDPNGRPACALPVAGRAGEYVGSAIYSFVDQGELHSQRALGIGTDPVKRRRNYPLRTFLGIKSDDPRLAEKLADADPVEVPANGYYLKFIRSGTLIPADQATATRAGVKFVSPTELLPSLAERFQISRDGAPTRITERAGPEMERKEPRGKGSGK